MIYIVTMAAEARVPSDILSYFDQVIHLTSWTWRPTSLKLYGWEAGKGKAIQEGWVILRFKTCKVKKKLYLSIDTPYTINIDLYVYKIILQDLLSLQISRAKTKTEDNNILWLHKGVGRGGLEGLSDPPFLRKSLYISIKKNDINGTKPILTILKVNLKRRPPLYNPTYAPATATIFSNMLQQNHVVQAIGAYIPLGYCRILAAASILKFLLKFQCHSKHL